MSFYHQPTHKRVQGILAQKKCLFHISQNKKQKSDVPSIHKNLMFQAFQRPWSLPDFENAGTSLNLSVSLKFLLSYGETQATTKRPQQNSTNTLPSTCWSNLVQIRSDRHILAYLRFGACINSKPQIRKSQYSAYKLVIIS